MCSVSLCVCVCVCVCMQHNFEAHAKLPWIILLLLIVMYLMYYGFLWKVHSPSLSPMSRWVFTFEIFGLNEPSREDGLDQVNCELESDWQEHGGTACDNSAWWSWNAVVLCWTTYGWPVISYLCMKVVVHTVSSNKSVFILTSKSHCHKVVFMTWNLKQVFSTFESCSARLFASGGPCSFTRLFITHCSRISKNHYRFSALYCSQSKFSLIEDNMD